MLKLLFAEFPSLCDSGLGCGHSRKFLQVWRCKKNMSHYILKVLMVIWAPLVLSQVANPYTDSPYWVGSYTSFQLSYVSASSHGVRHTHSPMVMGTSNFCKYLAFLRLQAVKDMHMLQWSLSVPIFICFPPSSDQAFSILSSVQTYQQQL